MGTLKTARHRGAAVALLLPVLIGTAGCGAGEKAPAGEAVYGQPLAEQFQAATDATRGAGTAAFVSTLTYGAAGGDAVQATRGSQDYGRGTSRADVALDAPRTFPEGTLELLRGAAPEGGQVLATADDDVYVRHAGSAWLKYTPEAVSKFGEATGDVAGHAAGDAAPYSGTLADLVPRTIPREAPERRADGSRVYRVDLLPEVAGELLPRHLRGAGDAWGTESVGLTVKLDADGRLASASADLAPVLAALHDQGMLAEVKRLRAAYELTAFGEPVKGPFDDEEPVEDAAEVLAPVATLKAGRCAATGGTGLGTEEIVRPVDCGDRHDIRVLGQVEVDRAFSGNRDLGNGDRYGKEECGRVDTAAPKDWRRGGRYADGFHMRGQSEVTVSVAMDGEPGNGTETTVTGSYTCFLTVAR
ncbi:hypothetical protein C5F59_012355 [Streptomyces sp. QL37]|uniref:hypothetical protein n=1 Tax=Streptomyces sp. QL37 TaxID=2093747 RepID=UPI000CF2E5EF|nr:hypothetical protein [Streptomyces sp. QL37]PPQ59795.1 hypothetical protein C5F59_26360 [Streptomyces sp. QL37]